MITEYSDAPKDTATKIHLLGPHTFEQLLALVMQKWPGILTTQLTITSDHFWLPDNNDFGGLGSGIDHVNILVIEAPPPTTSTRTPGHRIFKNCLHGSFFNEYESNNFNRRLQCYAVAIIGAEVAEHVVD